MNITLNVVQYGQLVSDAVDGFQELAESGETEKLEEVGNQVVESAGDALADRLILAPHPLPKIVGAFWYISKFDWGSFFEKLAAPSEGGFPDETLEEKTLRQDSDKTKVDKSSLSGS